MIEECLKKNSDFWDRHKIGTRLSLICFLITYMFTFWYPITMGSRRVVSEGEVIYVVKKIPHYEFIIEAVSSTTFLAFAVVSLGSNALVKIFEIYANIKKREKE